MKPDSPVAKWQIVTALLAWVAIGAGLKYLYDADIEPPIGQIVVYLTLLYCVVWAFVLFRVLSAFSDDSPRFGPESYDSYLSSREWKRKRNAALERSGHQCQECGKRSDLEVRHVSLRRLGIERAEDMMVMCDDCYSEWRWRETVKQRKRRAGNGAARSHERGARN